MGLATIDPHSQKEHTKNHKIPKFGVNQASFDCDKINKETYGHPDAVFRQLPDGHTFLCKFAFSNGCIMLTFGSTYTKLRHFVKLGPHFMTMWINSC